MAIEELALIEEELDVHELLRRIRAVESFSKRLDKLHFKQELEKVTDEEAGSFPTVERYVDALWEICRDAIQLKLKLQLDRLPKAELDATLRNWASMPDASDERRMGDFYVNSGTSEKITQEIAEYRADIAKELQAIREGLLAFGKGKDSLFWPILVTDVDGRHGNAAPQAECHVQVATSLPQEQKGTEGDYLKMLMGYIAIVIAKERKVSWDHVAKRIVVGDFDRNGDTTLLPTDFQNRIVETGFAGSLFEFINIEDRKRTEEIRKGADPKKIINFKKRFQNRFSAAKQAQEEILQSTRHANLRIPVHVGTRFHSMWAPDSVSCGRRFRSDVGSIFRFTVIGAHIA